MYWSQCSNNSCSPHSHCNQFDKTGFHYLWVYDCQWYSENNLHLVLMTASKQCDVISQSAGRVTILGVCFIYYINADKQTGQLMHWEASKYWLLFSVSLDSGYCCDAFAQYTAKCCIQTFASHRGKIWSIYLAGVGTLYFTNFVCRVDSLSRRSAMRSKVSTGWSLLGSD